MVEFLLENGSNVEAKTHGEGQTPIHFAAKNDAVNAMKMLLAYNSDINCIDYKNRTPLQVRNIHDGPKRWIAIYYNNSVNKIWEKECFFVLNHRSEIEGHF